MVSEDVRARVVSYIQHQAAKPADEIAAIVADSQSRLLGVLGAAGDEAARRKPATDEWSLHELVRHIIDAEDNVAGLVSQLARGRRPARRGAIGMMIDDAGAPYRELLARLRQVNERMVTSIRELPPDADTSTCAPHPWFGPLNCREWAVFQRVHDEDHVQHARKIVAALGVA